MGWGCRWGSRRGCSRRQQPRGLRTCGASRARACRRQSALFFQAEGGIRDKLVTGVQTCALPILSHRDEGIRRFWVEHGICCRRIGEAFGRALGTACVTNLWIPDGYKDAPADRKGPRERLRSVGRRVGEEGRSGGGQVGARTRSYW